MTQKILGLQEVSGSLIAIDNARGAHNEEIVEIESAGQPTRKGRIIQLDGDRAIVQVFAGTSGLSRTNTKTTFTGHPMELSLSREILNRTFNGAGQPIDGLGAVYAKAQVNINGLPLNPVARQYPDNFIETGISAIDGLNTLIRGQKLPIFSSSGMPHDKLAIQIVRQAAIGDEENFGIVFGAMGVKRDVADHFRKSFEETGVMEKVCMFVNLANDPIIERILTPRCALAAAEYLAFEEGMHILVILTDMTSYCEALREFSSSKGEIPGRKGYPGYLYSDLASIYERAGIIEGKPGSLTQIPILTMPNDDITHPVPDLTGYITEGQLVLDSALHQNGIFPPISPLASLSRLMKDGIGEGYTRGDHAALANQLFASYAKVVQARSLASVIGEDELSPIDQSYLKFGRDFEGTFLNQGFTNKRSIVETLDLGWALLSTLPVGELDRVDQKLIDANYHPENASRILELHMVKE
ncbi:MAG: V-type ATP synthase subunit B [Erysipelotrichaceae bacterium]|jgi:V/A-type H+-transporting ATPase subunit B|nr:V-type ATP synthase subunit B [Erysipelotrichaceae bacterium]